MVCCWRRVSLCRVQLPEARFGSPLCRDFGAERPSWLGGMAGDWAQKAFAHPILLPLKENPWGLGFARWRAPAKQQGPGIQVQPSPALPYGERRAGGENGLRCFPEPRCLRDVVCCWKRVSLCRMQLPEARFGLSLRRGLGPERPCWLRGHGRGLGEEGLSTPNPACPRRRTCVECDSGAGNPQQSSRAQGAWGSLAPLCPMESAGPGAKTACAAFLS